MSSQVMEFTKPVSDDRKYRLVRLENGLEALLIQDSTVDKASAALSVNVGSFADNEKFYGLAHFCEHLLFMGTEKYPDESEYRQYLTDHSGHSNAYTASDETNYFFDVAYEHLEGALDRFAQFFISPLFLEDCKDREIKAVDSENKKNLQNDSWRLHQLDRSLSNPAHPFSNFSTGNIKTLGTEPKERGQDVREELLKFYSSHYSANIMKLVVIGREDLDVLTDWVDSRFSLIRNTNRPSPVYKNSPFLKEHLGFVIKARPVKNSRYLVLSFPIPDQRQFFRSKPSHYYSHLIGHEGQGSLLQFFKKNELATGLSAGSQHISSGYDLFVINVKLTEAGLQNYEYVLEAVFQYLKLLNSTKPEEWIYEELKAISEADFKFKDKTSAYRTTSKLASVMQRNELPREFLLSTELLREYNPSLIEQLGKFLNPSNFRVMLLGQELEGLDKQEKWYGTEYTTIDFTNDFIKKLNDPEVNSELHLPPRNEFIPTNFDVDKLLIEKPLKHPSIIERSDRITVWHKKDDIFWIPKSRICVALRTPIASASPRNSLRNVMFIRLLNESLLDFAYDAEIAGLNYSVAAVRTGIEIIISGFNHKISILLKKVLDRLRNFEVDPSMFKILKEDQLQIYWNLHYSSPYEQITRYPYLLLAENGWHPDLKEAELRDLDVESLKSFIPEILYSLEIELLAIGNITKEETLEVSKLTKEILNVEPLHEAQKTFPRSYVLPNGEAFYHEVTLKDEKNVNSCIDYYLQVCEVTDNKVKVTLDLISQIASEPVFTRLRTQEQLGYIVFGSTRTIQTMYGYKVIVQSERNTEYLEARIESFFEYLGELISAMSDEELYTHKSALKAKYLEKNKNLGEEAGRYWHSVQTGYYDFLKHEREAKLLESIFKQDLINLFNQRLNPKSKTRAKLVVHLRSQVQKPETMEEIMTTSILKLAAQNNIEYTPDELETKLVECQGKNIDGVMEVLSVGLLEKGFSEEAAREFCEAVSLDIQTTLSETASSKEKYPEGTGILSFSAFQGGLVLNRAPLPVFDLSVYEVEGHAQL